MTKFNSLFLIIIRFLVEQFGYTCLIKFKKTSKRQINLFFANSIEFKFQFRVALFRILNFPDGILYRNANVPGICVINLACIGGKRPLLRSYTTRRNKASDRACIVGDPSRHRTPVPNLVPRFSLASESVTNGKLRAKRACT